MHLSGRPRIKLGNVNMKDGKDRELSSDLHTVLDRSLLCLEYTCVPLSNVDLTQQLENCSEEVSQYRPVPIVYM